jgi:hypothetical protein
MAAPILEILDSSGITNISGAFNQFHLITSKIARSAKCISRFSTNFIPILFPNKYLASYAQDAYKVSYSLHTNRSVTVSCLTVVTRIRKCPKTSVNSTR